MIVKMTPPKRDSDEAQLAPGRTSSSDLLIFNHSPTLPDRLVALLVLAMGIFGFYGVFDYAFSGHVFSSLTLLLGALFFFFAGYAGLTHVEELSIDFSQQTYQLRCGTIWSVTRTTGSLHDIGHLRLGSHHHSGRHESYDYMYAELLWRNHPEGWPRELMKTGVGKGFHLKSVRFGRDEESRINAKRELASYAAQLAARLHTSVIDVT